MRARNISHWVSQGSPWEPRKACPTSGANQVGGPPLDQFVGRGAGHNDTENQEIKPAAPPERGYPKQYFLDDEDREEPEGQVAYPVIVVSCPTASLRYGEISWEAPFIPIGTIKRRGPLSLRAECLKGHGLKVKTEVENSILWGDDLFEYVPVARQQSNRLNARPVL